MSATSGPPTANALAADSVVEIAPGVTMPVIGYGVFQIPADATERAVVDAIESGYRHIDTASIYGNEAAVGAGIRASGIDRSELFVTTKLWNDDQGAASAAAALDASLTRLGLDYVDLYLIHWPAPARGRYVETWQAFVGAREAGRTRAIGVSNFNRDHIETLADVTGVVPSVNQIELHPYLQQPELLGWLHERGIAPTAWSPLAKAETLADPEILDLAQRYGRTPAQIVLRWHLQRDTVVIPKSIAPSRMRTNRELFDFELGPADIAILDTLDRGYRTGPDPVEFN